MPRRGVVALPSDPTSSKVVQRKDPSLLCTLSGVEYSVPAITSALPIAVHIRCSKRRDRVVAHPLRPFERAIRSKGVYVPTHGGRQQHSCGHGPPDRPRLNRRLLRPTPSLSRFYPSAARRCGLRVRPVDHRPCPPALPLLHRRRYRPKAGHWAYCLAPVDATTSPHRLRAPSWTTSPSSVPASKISSWTATALISVEPKSRLHLTVQPPSGRSGEGSTAAGEGSGTTASMASQMRCAVFALSHRGTSHERPIKHLPIPILALGKAQDVQRPARSGYLPLKRSRTFRLQLPARPSRVWPTPKMVVSSPSRISTVLSFRRAMRMSGCGVSRLI